MILRRGGPRVVGSPRALRAMLVTYLSLIGIVLVPFLMLASPYAVSLLTGAIIAALVYPLYAKLRRRLPPWAASLAVTLGVLVLGIVPLTFMVGGMFRQGAVLVQALASEDTPTINELVEGARRWVPMVDLLGTPAELQAIVRNGVADVSTAASEALFRQVRVFPRLILQLVLVALSVYFSLVDGRSFANWLGGKLPISREIRHRLVGAFRSATTAVVLASIAAAGAQAVLVFLGFWLLGVPGAVLAAGATFILGWVPALPTVLWGGAAIYLYSEGSISKALIMVGIGLVVGLVDNVVRTVVLRGQREMHPMVSLVAILGGIVAFGVPGVVIGPLLACMVISVLDIWPSVASFCGIPVAEAGDSVSDVPMLGRLSPPPTPPPTPPPLPLPGTPPPAAPR